MTIGDRNPPTFQRGQVLTAAALNQLAQAVAAILARFTGPQAIEPLRLQGKLDGALDAAADSTTTPATATMSVYQKNSSGNMVDSGRDILVINRFQFADASAGSWCKAEWIDGEWQLYAVDCGG